MKASDGVFQPRVFRGRRLSVAATAATGTVAEILGERELERDIGARLHRFRGDITTEMRHYHAGCLGCRGILKSEKDQQGGSVYPEFLIDPMREELTRHGVRELRAAADVDEVLMNTPGTVMVVVNSVCGCAAGKARPGVALALQHTVTPDLVTTVFAGADVEATERARGYFTGYPPSSPAIAILRGGKLLYMMERHQIENQEAPDIAAQLTAAFDTHCLKTAVTG